MFSLAREYTDSGMLFIAEGAVEGGAGPWLDAPDGFLPAGRDLACYLSQLEEEGLAEIEGKCALLLRWENIFKVGLLPNEWVEKRGQQAGRSIITRELKI